MASSFRGRRTIGAAKGEETSAMGDIGICRAGNSVEKAKAFPIYLCSNWNVLSRLAFHISLGIGPQLSLRSGSTISFPPSNLAKYADKRINRFAGNCSKRKLLLPALIYTLFHLLVWLDCCCFLVPLVYLHRGLWWSLDFLIHVAAFPDLCFFNDPLLKL